MKRLMNYIFVTVAIFFSIACTKIDVDQIGVRINNYGPSKGVIPKDFSPGYRIKFANMHTWHYFPSTAQRLAMTKNVAQRGSGDRGPVQLRTADGFDILLDVYVYYKIADEKAHRLLEDIGPGERFKEILLTIAVDGCIAVFGTMQTEDFYISSVRKQKLLEARDFMHEVLIQRNIEVINVLILDMEFDPQFEQIIKNKKLADQRVLLNQSENRLAAQKGITDKIMAETDGVMRIIQQRTRAVIDSINAEGERQSLSLLADANKYAVEKKATADLVYNQKTARGNEALRTSEARSKQLITRSLAGAEGQNVAGLEAVKNLKIKELTISSYDEDWLDVINMAKRLSGQTTGK